MTTTSNTQNATVESNIRPDYDDEIQKIADYVVDYSIDDDSPNSTDAWKTARHCLMDVRLAAACWLCVFQSAPNTWDLIALNK